MILLIADDEKLIRFSLKSMLLEIVPEDTVIAEARNGNDLVEKCSLLQPDIAFVDINMPFLNGLDAIGECKKTSSYTNFIILTAYSDFEYAKTGIKLQVFDYLLKPISPDTLKDVLDRVSDKLVRTLESQNERFQLNVYNAFNMWDETGALAMDDFSQNGREIRCCGYVFFLDCPQKEASYSEKYKGLIEQLNGLGKAFLQKGLYYGLPVKDERCIQLIVRGNSNVAGQVNGRIRKICAVFSSPDFLITCFSLEAPGLSDMYHACSQAESKSYLRFLYPPASLHSFPNDGALPKACNLAAQFGSLLMSFWEGDEVQYQAHLTSLRKQVSDTSINTDAWPHIQVPCLCRYLQASTGITPSAENISVPEGRNGLFEYLQEIGRHLPRPDASCAPSGKTRQIQAYIGKNYMYDLSVSTLSAKFRITPNYLSSMFHERTGMKLIKYLTDVRMMNARRLLLENEDMTVKELASMVGYTSPRHFASLFYEYTGSYPSEYRKKCRL